MSDVDRDDKETWDLPGGELAPGVDVIDCLRKLVLTNTGYSIMNIRFYETLCTIRPRHRGVNPATEMDFVFTCSVEPTDLLEPAKKIELLPFANFEWLDSGKQFSQNKVMKLLGQYHHRQQALEDTKKLRIEHTKSAD